MATLSSQAEEYLSAGEPMGVPRSGALVTLKADQAALR
jgi:hypothetical protein